MNAFLFTKVINSVVNFFKSPRLFSTFFWGSLLTAVPLFGAAVSNGFQIQVIRNLQNGYSEPIPDWNDWKRYFKDGIRIVLAIYVVYIPLGLISVLSLIGDFIYLYAFGISTLGKLFNYSTVGTGDIKFPLWITGGVLIILNLICGAAVSFIFISVPAMVRRVSENNSFGVALDFPGHFMFELRNFKHYGITWLIVFILTLLASPIATFISGMFGWIPVLGVIIFWSVCAAMRFGGRLVWASQLGQMAVIEKSTFKASKTRGFLFLGSVLAGSFLIMAIVGGTIYSSVYLNEKIKEQINRVTTSESPVKNQKSAVEQPSPRLQTPFQPISNANANVNKPLENNSYAGNFTPSNNNAAVNVNKSNSDSNIRFEPELITSKFYESASGNLPLDERIYGTIFDSLQTRYANFEILLNFDSVSHKRRIPFKVVWYYGKDESVISRNAGFIEVPAYENSQYYAFGYGSNNYGNLQTGSYRVSVELSENFYVSKNFTVR
ncbi:MAG TPA: DUF4013 domain-containing protein [Pyrinomonadaceae bacterium]|nr:DUF4013 domain-containing protein [Pyrinomonadaceae bacterium]